MSFRTVAAFSNSGASFLQCPHLAPNTHGEQHYEHQRNTGNIGTNLLTYHFHKKNTSPYIVVIEYLITQFDICYTTAVPTLQWHSGVAKRGKHQSNSSNLNPIRILTTMHSSHRQLRQDKTVSSCQRYELSWRQSQTVFSSPQHIGD